MLKEEFATFAEKYMDPIYRVAYSWTKNSDDANESDSHLKKWLIRVTVNQCKMLFRATWNKMEDIGEYANTIGFELATLCFIQTVVIIYFRIIMVV